MLIKGNDASFIEIDILRYSDPNSADYWDSNWLDCECKAQVPGFKINIPVQLRTDELHRFFQSVKQGSENLDKEISLSTLEDGIDVKGQVDPLGKIYWKCKLMYPTGDGAVLNFTFESDFNVLDQLFQQLHTELQPYPIKGPTQIN